jgi:hypothetical protein
LRAGSRILRRRASTATVLLFAGRGDTGVRAGITQAVRVLDGEIELRTTGTIGGYLLLSFRSDRRGHCAKGGESEASMHVRRSWAKKIRKWLGLDKKSPDKVPYGAGVERS